MASSGNSTATLVNHLEYNAFGTITSQTNSAYQPLQTYTGQILDTATGLLYYDARWYDPGVAQFVSEDPIGFAAGDANLRRYVGNSMPNAVDPTGLEELTNAILNSLSGPVGIVHGLYGPDPILQGGVNIVNGTQDIVIDTVANTGPGTVYNSIAEPMGWIRIASPDWSKDMHVKDDPLHGISKWLGGQGVMTLASLGIKNSAAICAPTKDFARYGGTQQRQALLNQVKASGSLSEAKGVVHSFREMKRLGYELQDVSLNYRGNQGLDLIFHNGSRYAVVEAKHGKYLSLLKMYKGGLRQGSLDYNISRLERYIQYGDGTHNTLANQLLNEAYTGQLESFGTFYRSGRVLELPIGWPSVPAIPR